jgi:hypothetical protein
MVAIGRIWYVLPDAQPEIIHPAMGFIGEPAYVTRYRFSYHLRSGAPMQSIVGCRSAIEISRHTGLGEI